MYVIILILYEIFIIIIAIVIVIIVGLLLLFSFLFILPEHFHFSLYWHIFPEHFIVFTATDVVTSVSFLHYKPILNIFLQLRSMPQIWKKVVSFMKTIMTVQTLKSVIVPGTICIVPTVPSWCSKDYRIRFSASVTMDMTEQIVKKESFKSNEREVWKIHFKCVNSQYFSAFDRSWTVHDKINPRLGKYLRVKCSYDVLDKLNRPVPLASLEW